MDWTILVVIGGAAAAGLVQGLTGFAFGLVAISFWAWTMAPTLAAPLVVACSLLGQLLALGSLKSVRKAFNVSHALPFLVGGIAGVPVGVAVLKSIDLTAFKLLVGAVLLVVPAAMLAARRFPKITAGGRIGDGAVGFAGGLLGGIGGFSGALPTLWTSLRGWKKDVQRGVIQAFNLAMHAVTLAVYAATDVLTREAGWTFLLVAPAVVIAVLAGARLYSKASEETFRRIVLVLLALSGVALLVASVRG